jgi:hypothetical protein
MRAAEQNIRRDLRPNERQCDSGGAEHDLHADQEHCAQARANHIQPKTEETGGKPLSASLAYSKH